MRTLIATLFLLAVGLGQLNAETTVKQYKANKAKDIGYFDKAYIQGVGEGTKWRMLL